MSERRYPPEEPPEIDWARLRQEYDERGFDESDLRGYEPIQPEPGWRAIARRIWAPLAVIGALALKFKSAVFVIFKFKLFTVAFSMLVSIGAYALLWGWKFGVGLVLLLLVHEMGHVLEARRQGIPASAPMFIPFLGAFITMKQMPHNAWKEAQVALAGPLLGSAGAAVVWGAAAADGSDFLMALAFTGFFLNLFNLLPIVPLDGGRAVAAIHPGIWLAGLAALAGLAFVSPNPILLFILLIGAMELWNRWRIRHDAAAREYYRIAPWQRGVVAVTYLGLAAVLVLAMGATHIEREL